LVNYLENLDYEGAKGIVNNFFNEIYKLKKYHPTKVRMAAVEILHSFIKIAKKFEVEFELITSDNNDNPVDVLMKAETISDIRSWFEKLVEMFVDCLSNKKLSIERPEILKLKQYISERLFEDITLDKASKIANMSRSYLSSIFKKETGEAFTDYVNRLKMEEAKELIQKFGLKTYEAAEKLGFQDESYFSKLFKKYIGINPSKVNKAYKD
jgi:two-component system, response regulator YesN